MHKEPDAFAATVADGEITTMLAAIACEPDGKIEWEFERPFEDTVVMTGIRLGLIEENLTHFSVWSERNEIRLTKEGWAKLGLPMPVKSRSVFSMLLNYVMSGRAIRSLNRLRQ